MNTQTRILALLHGELVEGDQLSDLLRSLAASTEKQKVLVDQIALSRRFFQFGATIVPSPEADKLIWEGIANSNAKRSQSLSQPEEKSSLPLSFFDKLSSFRLRMRLAVVLFVIGIGIGYLLAQTIIGRSAIDQSQFVYRKASGTEANAPEKANQLIEPSIQVPASTEPLSISPEEKDNPQQPVERHTIQQPAKAITQPKSIAAQHQDFSGYWLHFDGKDDYVTIPDVPLDLSQSFAVEAYVQLETADQTGWIVEYSAPEEKGVLLLGLDKGELRLISYDLYNVANDLVCDLELAPQRWYHIVGIQDIAKEVVQIYVDGKLMSEGKLNRMTETLGLGTLFVGARDWFGTSKMVQFFNGGVRDISIWPRTLSQRELSESARNEKREGILAYWPLREDQGEEVKDVTGNHPGTIKGNPQRLPLNMQ